MKTKDSLGDRMKTYESVNRNYLTRRMPVIIRIDGKAFHTFTKGFNKPFDEVMMNTMHETCKYLCSNIQGCKVAYTQSDEISLLLTDYDSIDTSAWFDNNIQKMASVSASMATMAFNKYYISEIDKYYDSATETPLFEMYNKKIGNAMFDSRVFNIPKEEVCNYFIWRQQDATRNSIQMVGHANFSDKQLHGLSCDKIQDKLFVEKGINWNSFLTIYKRGSCTKKESYQLDNEQHGMRTKWITDYNIPVFTQDRNYIEKFI